MKQLIIILTMALSVCKADYAVSKDFETECEYAQCAVSFEDIEIPAGVFTVHRLTYTEEFYYCAYDSSTMTAVFYSSNDTESHQANGSIWQLNDSFGTPVSEGYQCFLDEVDFRGVTIP